MDMASSSVCAMLENVELVFKVLSLMSQGMIERGILGGKRVVGFMQPDRVGAADQESVK
jgi:hypothetical protein